VGIAAALLLFGALLFGERAEASAKVIVCESEHNDGAYTLRLMGDGQEITWPYNDYWTIEERYSAEHVVWFKTLNRSDLQYQFYVGRYDGSFIKLEVRGGDEELADSGYCREQSEKLF
jgi:hypothetical protein